MALSDLPGCTIGGMIYPIVSSVEKTLLISYIKIHSVIATVPEAGNPQFPPQIPFSGEPTACRH